MSQTVIPSPSPKSKSNKTVLIVVLVVVGLLLLGGIGTVLFTIFAANKAIDIVKDNADKLAYDDSVTTTGTNNNSDYSIKTDQGSINTSTKLPTDFPKDIPLYSGATLTSATTTKDNKTNRNGYIVGFTSNDSFTKVREYYDQQLKTNGWTSTGTDTSSSEDGQSHFYTASKGDLSIWLTLTSDKDGKTQISLVAGYGDSLQQQ